MSRKLAIEVQISKNMGRDIMWGFLREEGTHGDSRFGKFLIPMPRSACGLTSFTFTFSDHFVFGWYACICKVSIIREKRFVIGCQCFAFEIRNRKFVIESASGQYFMRISNG
jgi:hypothetical protein